MKTGRRFCWNAVLGVFPTDSYNCIVVVRVMLIVLMHNVSRLGL